MPIEWPKGKRPVFVGSGSTVCRRYFDGSKSHRANEAALMAIEDAGLTVDDIDGIYIRTPYGRAGRSRTKTT